MFLRIVINEMLEEKSRTMTWLSGKMGKTHDGLVLGLERESIKYRDLKKLAMVLEVSPAVFFEMEAKKNPVKTTPNFVLEPIPGYANEVKNNLRRCKEMVFTLKEQIKDKDKIISLLSRS